MSNQLPKNEIIKGTNKATERVFIKEIHSCPELMSYAERLELGQEIFSEILLPILKRERLTGEIDEVDNNQFVLQLSHAPSTSVKLELEHLVWEETQGIFSLLLRCAA